MTFAALGSALSRSLTMLGRWLDVGLALRMYVYRSSEVGNAVVVGFYQLILIFRTAEFDCFSRSPTTVTSLPFLTTLTSPGTSRTDDSSMLMSLAPATGGLTLRA